jgi:GNAT superfamily N-acetyltransferase
MRYNFALGPDNMDDFVPYSHHVRTIYAHILVTNKGEFVGISRVYKSGEIADVFIMEGYRGRGIGKRMLERLISGISGDKKLWLYTTAARYA